MSGDRLVADIISLPCYAPDAIISGDFVLGPTSPGKWGPSGVMGTTGGVVTWSLMGPGVSLAAEGAGFNTPLSAFMPAGFHAEIVAAFATWSSVADISFVEVPDSGPPPSDQATTATPGGETDGSAGLESSWKFLLKYLYLQVK